MKFKSTRFFDIFVGVIITVLSGCTGYHYVSSPQYVPLNDKKGEFDANISFNTLQFGYTITDNICVFSTGTISGNIELLKDGGKENSGYNSKTYRQYSVDLGASLFKRSRLFNYEVLAGFGAGKVAYKNEIDLWPTDYISEMNAQKANVFLQPDFGYKFRNLLEFGIFSKLVYEKYYNIQSSTVIGSNVTIDPDDEFFANRTHADLFFAEPRFLIRAGFKKIKFYSQWSVPLNLTNTSIRYRPLNLFLGVSFSTGTF